MSESPSPETPHPTRGTRLDTDYSRASEHLQARLLQIGLSLLAVVVLGGGAGILSITMNPGSAFVASVSVVAGSVIAVMIALLCAGSATRKIRLPELTYRAAAAAYPQRPPSPSPVPPPTPAPAPTPAEQAYEAARKPQPAPLWAHPDELPATLTDDPGQRREVFVKLARRLQSLINRSIQRIDQLEQDNEDPVLLDGLYEIDHLFTLARRQGENLAVLGGEPPQRRSNRPVSVYAVLLAAVSEAEHYRQIAIVPVEDVEIHGHAVAEIIHLLAELLENATRFTSPDGPKVEVRAHKVTAGLAIEVQDRGLGMSYEDLERINHLLDGSTRIDVSELLQDGRIGLAVVRELARRHGIRVRLQSNIFGGIAAAVVIPPHLLSEAQPVAETRRRVQPSPVQRERRVEQQAIPAAPEPPRPTLEPSPRPTSQPSPQVSAPGLTAPPLSAPALSSVHLTQPTSRRQAPAEPEAAPADHGQADEQHWSRESALPELPVRAPGRSYNELRSGVHDDAEEQAAQEQAGNQPPPLPQRRGTHLREELLEPPAPAPSITGHNTRLMAAVQEGRDHWLTEQIREASPHEPTQAPTRGESAAWPTT
ncbi:Histidine kinase-, DNA gyrase B-, and HSP90-like ATPase [Actinokineospora alba]|uniref:histidine kinase n=1 Tax=Actinokineospora alba TaxID=504798 RepID=A0A1H0R8B2_9PSEU|nr:ATP-binding protein [Actinokineospora alba]TDP70205.1 histidine kinase/DNA gyrase B/HSP90-like ATPase [Actinokineospora alba]SDI36847.1 Histidine kinase-, DNA gyrase B-, and HSP90-like ATPase [Actinokineospora alba]SDP25690.1 Histidine kinase-, DNA gyrase B-, and HSP90-like ATPase [Actinokineospora alba]